MQQPSDASPPGESRRSVPSKPARRYATPNGNVIRHAERMFGFFKVIGREIPPLDEPPEHWENLT